MNDIVEQAKIDWQIAETQAQQCCENDLEEYHAHNVLARKLWYEYWVRKAKDVDKTRKVSS